MAAESPERVDTSPQVTTTTSPTNPNNIFLVPKTHQRKTRSNTPMTTTPIVRDEHKRRVLPRLNPGTTYEAPLATPNSNRIPLVAPHIISQEAINYLTDKVWDCTTGVWAAKEILVEEATNTDHQNSLQDVDIEHFCAAAVHPDTGETVTQYKKLVNDPNPTLRKT